MICPKCGVDTATDECSGCGVIISRYAASIKKKADEGGVLDAVLSEIQHGFRTRILIDKYQKSGVVAAILNFIFPGAGYWYADRKMLAVVVGIVALIVLCISFVTFGIAWLVSSPVWILMAFDGFLQVDKFNKGILQKALDGELV